MRVRGRPLLILGMLGAAAIAIGLVLLLGPRTSAEPVPIVTVQATDVITTPRSIQIRMQDGGDRLLQRERFDRQCRPGVDTGCPSSTAPGSVPVFLVRDEVGTAHAFIGTDPRNGCGLEWLADYERFHDMCHGSLYDRRGRVMGGPSPQNLTELGVEANGAALMIDPAKITTAP